MSLLGSEIALFECSNHLLTSRLIERGSRFVQLHHTNWDSHGGPGENPQQRLRKGLQRRRPSQHRPQARLHPRPKRRTRLRPRTTHLPFPRATSKPSRQKKIPRSRSF
ncbi:MAG: DUF1501 domain-containing protein [Akkermansiaceae bacterium]|nr:DUF1501 domain-containing protein [Akkermansiaceae bacterium]